MIKDRDKLLNLSLKKDDIFNIEGGLIMKIHRLGTPISYRDLTNETLCDEEYNLLQQISSKTKMDCWFSLERDLYEDREFIADLEDSTSYNLQEGINYLMEGLDCIENLEHCDLSLREILLLENLLKRLELPSIVDYIIEL